ncbi:MAG: 50S ribosomal protein L16 [Planctomycetota bacterium]
MSLMPKRIKHRKVQRGRVRGKAARGDIVAFGEYGLQALEPGWIPAKTIEAGRVACTRNSEGAKVFIRIVPHKPVSGKPAETRMGKGKGEPDFWAAVVKPGVILYELVGCTEEIAKKTFNRVAHKMPVRTRMVRRRPV